MDLQHANSAFQGLQTSELDTRDVKSAPVSLVATSLDKKSEDAVEEKRESTTSIDAINLNVDDPQGITMTFVETSEDDEE